jgi:hypothetical protein
MQVQTSVSPAMRIVRVLLLALAVAGLLFGMWAGLIRLGWVVAAAAASDAAGAARPADGGRISRRADWAGACGRHRPSLGLCRAGAGGARRRRIAGGSARRGRARMLITAGSLIVTLGAWWGWCACSRRSSQCALALGGLAWVIGNALWWLGWPLPVAALWWMGFLVLTIAGERLELSRMLKLSAWSQRAFVGATALLLIGLVVGVFAYTTGMAIVGLAFLAIAGVAVALRHCPAAHQGGGTGALHGVGADLWLRLACRRRNPTGTFRGPHRRAVLRRRATQHLSRLCLRYDLRPRAHRLSGGAASSAGFQQSFLHPARSAAYFFAAAYQRRSSGSGKRVCGAECST